MFLTHLLYIHLLRLLPVYFCLFVLGKGDSLHFKVVLNFTQSRYHAKSLTYHMVQFT